MKRSAYSRLSIRQRLSLLICTLLLSAILIFGFISWLGVKKAALKTGEDRLKNLTEELSDMLTNNVKTFISGSYTAANKPAVKAFLSSNGKDSLAEAMKILDAFHADSFYVKLELRNKERRTVFVWSRPGVKESLIADSMIERLSLQSKPDSGMVGKLYRDDSSVYYPIIATVVDNGKAIGWIVRWRKMEATPKSIQQLSQLLGTDAKLFIGNSDGSVWTDMRRPVALPSSLNKSNELVEYSLGQGAVLAYALPVANSRWSVAVGLSKKKILQTANNFLYWLMLAAAVILLAGIIAAQLISGNIIRPLRRLTAVSSEIAAGNYSSSVQVDRLDELGKLARAFNAMSSQVQKAQARLEKEATNYKLLFEKNPMPMWIMSKADLSIMDVNDAAVRHYGYSKDEFLKLHSTDLRPQEDVERYLAHIRKNSAGLAKKGIWRHKKKDGVIFMADVIADDIVYNNRPARLILANDVTEKLEAEAELVRHRVMEQKLITETTLQAREKEREELGKELHDNINQILASTKLYLDLARTGTSDYGKEAILKSYENVNLAISEIRKLSKQLVYPSLNTSLIEALVEITSEIQAITPVAISFKTEDFQEDSMDDEMKLMIYRVVQEQTNNILKHAAASEIKITLGITSDTVHLIIADNGVGFDTKQKSKGIGLKNIEARVKFYEGVAAVISQPGNGCRLEIAIPLAKKPAPVDI